MLDTGVITRRIYARRVDAKVGATPRTGLRRDPGAVLLRLRARQADRGLRRAAGSRGRPEGLHDDHPALPAARREAIRDTLDESDDPAAALISISPRTGAIRAMAAVVPNRPKEPVQPSLAGASPAGLDLQDLRARSRGRAGHQPDSTYYVSAPFTYRAHPAGNCDDGSWWCVKTYANDYYGWSSVRSATLRSDNTVYAQLTLDVTPQKVADVARRMGVRSQLDVKGAYVPSIGLGSIAVSPLDIASAYATLGRRRRLRGADGDPPRRSRGRDASTPRPGGASPGAAARSPRARPRSSRASSSRTSSRGRVRGRRSAGRPPARPERPS